MTFALVFVKCYPDKVSSAEKKVREVKGVVESHPTTGAYDMVLKVKTKDEKELRNTIRNVALISGIGSILTSIVYNIRL
jgi:DNA-binding Lrp family transcriptional regulator